MTVKTHPMCYDEDGNLVDTKENDLESPEVKLAALMTKYFAEMSQSFPVLARLQELAKLQSIAIFAQLEQQANRKAFTSTFKKGKIAFRCKKEKHKCNQINWVPAAFRKGSFSRTYGGVNLMPNLVLSKNPTGIPNKGNPNGAPSRGNPNGAPTNNGGGSGRFIGPLKGNNRATCIIKVNADGDVSYKASYTLDGKSKQYMRGYRNKNSTVWASKFGAVDHYTNHHGVSSHTHYRSGDIHCNNKNGQTQTYRSGDYHRCVPDES